MYTQRKLVTPKKESNMSSHSNCAVGISMTRTSGDNEPSHFILKIESFSLLSEAGIQKYESDVFAAGDYKWRLILYPNGNKEEDGENHISLYLMIIETADLPYGWGVNALFKFFIYDHIQNNYATFQDAEGKKRRFDALKSEWGFAKLLSTASFMCNTNGYLLNDSCVLGAEVFVTPKYAQTERCLSLMKPPTSNNTYTWIVYNFSTIKDEVYSEDFKVGSIKWKILLKPKAKGTKGDDQHLSLYLKVAGSESLLNDRRVYATYKLRVKDQYNNNHEERSACHWFCSKEDDWGWANFQLLSDVNDEEKGFLVDDKLIVEAEITILGVVKNFT